MRASTLSLAAALAVFLLAPGCAHNPPSKVTRQPGVAHRTLPSAPDAQTPQARRPPWRNELPSAAHQVRGDYSGYPALDDFIARMVSQNGFASDELISLFSRAQRKQWTLNYLSKESLPGSPPSPGSWTRYRSKFLTERHISSGAAFWAAHARDLERASKKFGVSPEHIVGIIGVETLFGANVGTHRVLDALTTLAFDYPRRGKYFEEELEHFLIMTRDERLDPLEPVGSYAGAMGLGQFMPSSFRKFAVDFNGDGKRNLWNPVDAIGSVANYFASHGWRTGEPVVTAASTSNPAVQSLKCGFDEKYPLRVLADYGIEPASADLPGDSARLLRLRASSGDEYWLGHENFYVITRYNHSTHYAMAVHQLAQAIKRRYLQNEGYSG